MSDGLPIIEGVKFILDGREVEARPGETIWQVASRHGTDDPASVLLARARLPRRRQLPRLHGRDRGRARARRLLHPQADAGHEGPDRERARRDLAQAGVRAAGRRPARARGRARSGLRFLALGRPRSRSTQSRFPAIDRPTRPTTSAIRRWRCSSTPASTAISASAPAARSRSTTSSAWPARGHLEKIVFDFDDPMGASTCVACGECVQACPTGALMPTSLVDEAGVSTSRTPPTARSTASAPTAASAASSPTRSRTTASSRSQGRDGPANQNRLCVKGRFGFDYVHHPDRLTKPLIRKDGVSKHDTAIDPADPWTHFREATWDEALERAAGGLKRIRDRDGGDALAGFGSAKGSNEEAYLFQKLVRTGFGTNNVDHCTRLCHASSVAGLMEGDRLGRRDGAVHGRRGRRRDRRHRRQPDREPPGRRDLLQERGQARRQARRHGPARPGPEAPRHAHAAVQARPRRGAAQRHAAHDRRGGALRPAIRPGAHRGFRGAREQRRATSRRRRWPRSAASPPRRLREVARALRPRRGGDHLLGHGHLAARPRHRQRPLPDRAGARRPARSAAPAPACTRCAARTTCRAPPTPA